MAFEFPNIDPVALAIGPLEIRWYALAYVSGFLVGWRYCMRLARWDDAYRPSREDIDDFLTWVIVGVIMGGRLGYVLFYNLGYYLQNPIEAFYIWQGGMSFHGGALGVIAALFIYPALKKFPPLRLCDIVCAAVPIGLFFGRAAPSGMRRANNRASIRFQSMKQNRPTIRRQHTKRNPWLIRNKRIRLRLLIFRKRRINR